MLTLKAFGDFGNHQYKEGLKRIQKGLSFQSYTNIC